MMKQVGTIRMVPWAVEDPITGIFANRSAWLQQKNRTVWSRCIWMTYYLVVHCLP